MEEGSKDEDEDEEDGDLVDGIQEVFLGGNLPPGPVAEVQRCRGAEVETWKVQRCRSAEVQRSRGGEVVGGGVAPDGEHAGLRADAPELGPRGVGAQPRQQLVPAGGVSQNLQFPYPALWPPHGGLGFSKKRQGGRVRTS